MNDRGQYGRRSSSPYGGAPDEASRAMADWAERAYAPPRFGRGYGPSSYSQRGYAYVGQGGSVFGHTPGDTENELDQLGGEILSFDQEVVALTKPLEEQARAAVQSARDEELAAQHITDSFLPLVQEVERIEALLNAAGVDKKRTALWRESVPPYADIVMTPLGKNESLKQIFIAAKSALDKFMPKEQRRAAAKRATELTAKRSEIEYKAQAAFPLVQWKRSVWDPFMASWTKFRREKKDIAWQMLPGSGTWDRIQDYRKQFIELRKSAPFKAQGPTPLDPSDRKDPSLTGGIGDALSTAGSILKWTLIGVLGIGGVVVLTSVASNVKKGRDPVEHYTDVYKGLRR